MVRALAPPRPGRFLGAPTGPAFPGECGFEGCGAAPRMVWVRVVSLPQKQVLVLLARQPWEGADVPLPCSITSGVMLVDPGPLHGMRAGDGFGWLRFGLCGAFWGWSFALRALQALVRVVWWLQH